MVYKIKNKKGKVINTIVAQESFVQEYCKQNDYTYELQPEPEIVPVEPTPEPEYATYDDLAAAIKEGVNSI